MDLIREEDLWNAIRKIKNKKKVRLDRVTVEVWKDLGNLGIEVLY